MKEKKKKNLKKTQKVKGRKGGPTGSRTQVAGFKVQSANHYTIEPLSRLDKECYYLLRESCFLAYTKLKSQWLGQSLFRP